MEQREYHFDFRRKLLFPSTQLDKLITSEKNVSHTHILK